MQHLWVTRIALRYATRFQLPVSSTYLQQNMALNKIIADKL